MVLLSGKFVGVKAAVYPLGWNLELNCRSVIVSYQEVNNILLIVSERAGVLSRVTRK
jgi:hypothetical protein